MGARPGQKVRALRAVAMVIVGIAGGCDSGPSRVSNSDEPHGSAIDGRSRTGEHNPFHGYPSQLYYGAHKSLVPLLRYRATLRLEEFDSSIRELAKVSCTGASPDVLAIVSSAPVEDLYPLSRLADCKRIVCGGCLTGTGTAHLLGRAFKSLPPLQPPLLPELEE
jgi:hypothetical protein